MNSEGPKGIITMGPGVKETVDKLFEAATKLETILPLLDERDTLRTRAEQAEAELKTSRESLAFTADGFKQTDADRVSAQARAKRAEAALKEIEEIMGDFEQLKPNKYFYQMLIERIRDRIALSRGE